MPAKKHIVIVTQLDDPHTDAMILTLREMGHAPIRLNTDDIPQHTSLSMYLGSDASAWEGGIKIHTNDRLIDIDDIRSIWWRRPSEFALPEQLSEQEREFAKLEIEHTLRSLWASLDCYWVSYPAHIRQATWKGEQLKRAKRLGFEVPRTLITTQAEDVRGFYEACNGQMIFKVMSDPLLAANKTTPKIYDEPPVVHGTYTTLITEAELAKIETVGLVPCLFQEYIPKQVELRVTVIGDEVFAAEIHSQEHEQTRVDWRHYEVDIPYRQATLPPAIVERCLAFTRSYGLNFSAIDLILTPDGRYVFLENNPNGQFMFIENLVPELRMTEALASCLIRGANS